MSVDTSAVSASSSASSSCAGIVSPRRENTNSSSVTMPARLVYASLTASRAKESDGLGRRARRSYSARASVAAFGALLTVVGGDGGREGGSGGAEREGGRKAEAGRRYLS